MHRSHSPAVPRRGGGNPYKQIDYDDDDDTPLNMTALSDARGEKTLKKKKEANDALFNNTYSHPTTSKQAKTKSGKTKQETASKKRLANKERDLNTTAPSLSLSSPPSHGNHATAPPAYLTQSNLQVPSMQKRLEMSPYLEKVAPLKGERGGANTSLKLVAAKDEEKALLRQIKALKARQKALAELKEELSPQHARGRTEDEKGIASSSAGTAHHPAAPHRLPPLPLVASTPTAPTKQGGEGVCGDDRGGGNCEDDSHELPTATPVRSGDAVGGGTNLRERRGLPPATPNSATKTRTLKDAGDNTENEGPALKTKSVQKRKGDHAVAFPPAALALLALFELDEEAARGDVVIEEHGVRRQMRQTAAAAAPSSRKQPDGEDRQATATAEGGEDQLPLPEPLLILQVEEESARNASYQAIWASHRRFLKLQKTNLRAALVTAVQQAATREEAERIAAARAARREELANRKQLWYELEKVETVEGSERFKLEMMEFRTFIALTLANKEALTRVHEDALRRRLQNDADDRAEMTYVTVPESFKKTIAEPEEDARGALFQLFMERGWAILRMLQARARKEFCTHEEERRAPMHKLGLLKQLDYFDDFLQDVAQPQERRELYAEEATAWAVIEMELRKVDIARRKASRECVAAVLNDVTDNKYRRIAIASPMARAVSSIAMRAVEQELLAYASAEETVRPMIEDAVDDAVFAVLLKCRDDFIRFEAARFLSQDKDGEGEFAIVSEEDRIEANADDDEADGFLDRQRRDSASAAEISSVAAVATATSAAVASAAAGRFVDTLVANEAAVMRKKRADREEVMSQRLHEVSASYEQLLCFDAEDEEDEDGGSHLLKPKVAKARTHFGEEGSGSGIIKKAADRDHETSLRELHTPTSVKSPTTTSADVRTDDDCDMHRVSVPAERDRDGLQHKALPSPQAKEEGGEVMAVASEKEEAPAAEGGSIGRHSQHDSSERQQLKNNDGDGDSVVDNPHDEPPPAHSRVASVSFTQRAPTATTAPSQAVAVADNIANSSAASNRSTHSHSRLFSNDADGNDDEANERKSVDVDTTRTDEKTAEGINRSHSKKSMNASVSFIAFSAAAGLDDEMPNVSHPPENALTKRNSATGIDTTASAAAASVASLVQANIISNPPPPPRGGITSVVSSSSLLRSLPRHVVEAVYVSVFNAIENSLTKCPSPQSEEGAEEDELGEVTRSRGCSTADNRSSVSARRRSASMASSSSSSSVPAAETASRTASSSSLRKKSQSLSASGIAVINAALVSPLIHSVLTDAFRTLLAEGVARGVLADVWQISMRQAEERMDGSVETGPSERREQLPGNAEAETAVVTPERRALAIAETQDALSSIVADSVFALTRQREVDADPDRDASGAHLIDSAAEQLAPAVN